MTRELNFLIIRKILHKKFIDIDRDCNTSPLIIRDFLNF